MSQEQPGSPRSRQIQGRISKASFDNGIPYQREGLPPYDPPYPVSGPRLPAPSKSRFEPAAYSHSDAEKGHAGFVKLSQADDDATVSPAGKGSSWHLMSRIKTLDHDDEDSDPRESQPTLDDGDAPESRSCGLWNYLGKASTATRWTIYIFPVLAILWIPGILGLTVLHAAEIWGVRIIWWSSWLCVAWMGWWAALAFALFLPRFARYTLGEIAATTRRYIAWLAALQSYIVVFLWTLVIWIAYQPLINARQRSNASEGSLTAIGVVARLLFGIFLCAAVLLGEKFAIQVIAGDFHERSYAERIADQRKAIRILVTLYEHSSDISGRTDTSDEDVSKSSINPLSIVGDVATMTTPALASLITEIFGSAALPPDSPQAIVAAALGSESKTRLLAQRLFYSFVQPGAHALFPSDIAKFFRSQDEAYGAFNFFDKDRNGDVTRDEVEMACMECHREQLSIANSMKDLGTAVGRLDNIFMSLYTIIVAIILAVVLDSKITVVLTGAGTIALGLSWLIGGSLAELLTSIIFMFVKHPYDVGDRVEIGQEMYIVKEIQMLSTVFLDKNNTLVQAPHAVLSDQFVRNIRRSPTMSETFSFDVAFHTTFEQVEALRDKMLAFLKGESRDFMPSFDVVVVDIPGQEKMSLAADIRYRSNWQQGTLKANRRNKWICALKQSMAELGIYGPAGNQNASNNLKRYTLSPWDEAKRHDAEVHSQAVAESGVPFGSYRLVDHNAVLSNNFRDDLGEADQLAMSNPRQTVPRPRIITRPSGPRRAGEMEMETPSRAG